MNAINTRTSYSLEEKLSILSAAARYDAACTSSGVNRRGSPGTIGNAKAAGICHSFSSDGRCISLLKVLLTNECIFDCKYCLNRASNDVERTSFTPDELCRLTIEFYRRNFIEGLFLSSGVKISPNHTMELIFQTLHQLRFRYHFNGYIHVKIIPGADEDLIEKVGFLADRVSVNMELPTAESLRLLAPHKSFRTILTPMRRVQEKIVDDRSRDLSLDSRGYAALPGVSPRQLPVRSPSTDLPLPAEALPSYRRAPALDTLREHPRFVPAGQSTQMIIGATPETDYQIVHTAQQLYQNYDLKRVFYSAYVGVNEDSLLPSPDQKPPLLREHRLYQADWLMRFYGFQAGELLSESRPNFNVWLDPKCDWAVRHLEYFPVPVESADYFHLLRVPGIGVKSARRILQARKHCTLDFPDLKKMGVVLKRAHYFITCRGRMMYPVKVNETSITASLVEADRRKSWQIAHREDNRQLSLFDDFHLT